MAPDSHRTDPRPLFLAGAATILYLLTAPATVNADGLGYLKLLPHNFAAGHLLFMPLLRGATRHGFADQAFGLLAHILGESRRRTAARLGSAEPSGAITVAALLEGLVRPDGPTVAVLSGGNIEWAGLLALLGDG